MFTDDCAQQQRKNDNKKMSLNFSIKSPSLTVVPEKKIS